MNPVSATIVQIWAMAEDGSGNIWVGTNSGLDLFDPDRHIVTRHYEASPDGLRQMSVRSLMLDHAGNLWVGTFSGLGVLHPGAEKFVSYRHNNHDPRSLSDDGVVALHEDSAYRLWVGTLGGGLNLFDTATGTFTSYTNFPSNVIYGIEEDAALPPLAQYESTRCLPGLIQRSKALRILIWATGYRVCSFISAVA